MNQQILMNFTYAPMDDDILSIANAQLELLPDELLERFNDLKVTIEEFPDEATESDLDLEDPYDLMALYKAGKDIAPGVEKKIANDDDVLVLYRRPLLDGWCETGDDLTQVIRDAMIEEIGSYFDFSEDDIEQMSAQHYQGAL